jgi:2-aminoethylphosphonate-pyruvate transaminase
MDDGHSYLLLTPGPLTTSNTVKQAMMRDCCTWDRDYHQIVTGVRARLVELAGGDASYTSVLMQGSGTFTVEATIGSVIPPDGKLVVVDNGAYGRRIAEIARRLKIACVTIEQPETEPADLGQLEGVLRAEPDVTHVAVVHCETTTGLLNPAEEVGALCRRYEKTYILDAMSSFGGIPMTVDSVGAHYLISSANKCIQGVPGFGFVVAHRPTLEGTAGWARSLSLDLFDQWHEMETKVGKWRYTSPTHVLLAFTQALRELAEEGGIAARNRRYRENQRLLVQGMAEIGFRTLIAREFQSPIITSFLYPEDIAFHWETFYAEMKARGFVLYPGKLSDADTFRIGTIGHIFPDDIRRLVRQVREAVSLKR